VDTAQAIVKEEFEKTYEAPRTPDPATVCSADHQIDLTFISSLN
jgi:hypothetical protein